MTSSDIQEIRLLRTDMSKCTNQMVSLEAHFTTWQVTRCEDNRDRIEAIELKYGELELAQTKIIAKSAGVVAAVVGIINIVTVVIGFMALQGRFN